MRILSWLRQKLFFPFSYRKLVVSIHQAHRLTQEKEFQKASPIFVRALEHRDLLKNNPALLKYVICMLGGIWSETEEYEKSIRFFSEYIERYPGDVEAYHSRGVAFWYAEDLAHAIHDYSHILEFDPKNIPALAGRAQIFAETGDFEVALKELDKVLQILGQPLSEKLPREAYRDMKAFVHRARGVALTGLGDNAGGISEINQSIAMCPENAWAYYSRAQFFDASGDHGKAAADFKLALEKSGPKLNRGRRERAQQWLQSYS